MFYGDGSVYDGLWCRNARYTPAAKQPSETQLHLLYTFAYLVQARQGDPQTTRPVGLLRRLEGRQEVRCAPSHPRISNKAEDQSKVFNKLG